MDRVDVPAGWSIEKEIDRGSGGTTRIITVNIENAPRDGMEAAMSPPLRTSARSCRGALAALLLMLLLIVVSAEAAPPARFDVLPGEVLSRGHRVHATVADVQAIDFWFVPTDTSAPPVFLGADLGRRHPVNYGPVCDGPCIGRDVFTTDLAALRGQSDMFGRLVVRPHDKTTELGTIGVYWAEHSPRARFVSAATVSTRGATGGGPVAVRTLDPNVSSVNVYWMPAPGSRRAIPRFEQHQDGAVLGFGGYISCAPASMGAALQYLQETGQAAVNPSALSPTDLVTDIGYWMNTNNYRFRPPLEADGTSGADNLNGTVDWLDVVGYHPGSYEIEHAGVPVGSNTPGLPPAFLMGLFQASQALTVGIHNFAPGDPALGHVLAVSDVVLNANGSAEVRLMDPFVVLPPSPGTPATQGRFRSLHMHPNGTLDWTSPGETLYYDPPSGRVKLDEYVMITGLPATNGGSGGGPLEANLIPLSYHPNTHEWRGTFQPPADATGPFLLISVSEDTAGHTLKAYQYVTLE